MLPYPVDSRYVAIWSCSARLGHGAALSALRRPARLKAHPALPPSPPLPAPKPHTRGERGRSSASFIVTEPRRSQPDYSARTPESLTDQSPRCVPLIRSPASSSAPLRSVPRRAGPDRSLPPGEQFIPWKLDELLESCEQVREESCGLGSASSLRPGKTRLSQSCGR